jgi:hypothetical protein
LETLQARLARLVLEYSGQPLPQVATRLARRVLNRKHNCDHKGSATDESLAYRGVGEQRIRAMAAEIAHDLAAHVPVIAAARGRAVARQVVLGNASRFCPAGRQLGNPDRDEEPAMSDPQVLMAGISFGEQPRWRGDRLWFSDWGPREVIAVDLQGNHEVVLQAPAFPCCVDWLPDGRLLVVSAREGLLLCREPDGSLVTYADLNAASRPPAGNDLFVDGRGNAYVNDGGFDLIAGEPFAPGVIALAASDGTVRQVADGLAFPDGMLVTADNRTLIVAESYAKRLTAFEIAAHGSLSNRRVWADLAKVCPTASASTQTALSGTATSPTSGAYAYAKAARCCKRSISIAAASLLRSEAWKGERCS